MAAAKKKYRVNAHGINKTANNASRRHRFVWQRANGS